MGIFFSEPNKASGKFDKFKQIGGLSGQNILKKMSYADRAKLKGVVKGIGSKRMSIQQASKLIGEKHGSSMKDKFLTAAEKQQSGGLTEKQKQRNIRATMATDTSGLDEERGYSRSKISVLGQVGGGVKGTAENRFGLKKADTGFAGQRSASRPQNSKPSTGGPGPGTNPPSPPRPSGGGGGGIPLAR